MAEVKTVTIEIDVKTGSITKGREEFDKLNSTVNKGTKDMSNSMSNLNTSITNVGTALVGAFAIQQVVADAFQRITGFEKAMSSLSAITGVTGKGLEELKGKVLAVAKETKKGASDVAAAFELVGSKAPKLLEDADALAAVTKEAIILSKATGEELVDSASSLTGVMNQFNLEATDSERIINALAAGSQKGAAPVGQISQAIDKFGTVANAANVSVEASIGLVETLAEKNINGAEAGTQLRNIILKLQSANIGFTDGVFNLNDALQEVKDKNLSAAESAKLFGLESVTAGNILVNNIGTIDQYTKAVTGTNTANEQAITQTDNLSSKLEELDATYESLLLSIEDGDNVLSNVFKGLVEGVDNVLSGTTGLLNLDFNNAADGWNTYLQALTGIDFELDQITPKIDNLTNAVSKYGAEQIKANSVELTKLYINAGLSADEAAQKVVGLYQAKMKDTAITVESTDATNENTTSTDKNNKSKEKQLTLLEAQKKLQADFKNELEGSRGLQDEIVTDEQELADKALFDFISREEAKNTALEESLQTERDIKAENRLAEFDAFMSDEEARLEFQQKVAESKQQINQQLMFGALGLASALANAAGGSMSAQMAALVFEKTAAAASVIISTQVANAKALALFGTPLLAAPSIIANKTLGAIQLATILATAIPQAAAIQKPKFKDGVIDLQGKGTATSDSIPAMLSKGESVMTAKETQEYKPVLKAMREGTFDDYINRVIVQQLYNHKTKERVKVKEVKQAQINFPKGFKVTNAKDISRPLLDAMEESKFLNQNSSWR